MKCPHCTNSDSSMIEELVELKDIIVYLCGVCSKRFVVNK